MSFDLESLRAHVARHGRVARVVVAEARGSTPREVGASMLVWQTPEGRRQSGTIGGGALEWEAAHTAFEQPGARRVPLGPDLGQCCGGAVTLLCEVFDADTLPEADRVFARPVTVQGAAPPPEVRQALGGGPAPQMIAGWFVEPIAPPAQAVFVWGAGHVGRALVSVLAPMPQLRITWLDTAPDRFPAAPPEGVTALPVPALPQAMARAPQEAAHIILTYSHALDLQLCDAALRHGFGFCGLIGSDTKWARFSRRLQAIGHGSDEIARICCPIGQKALGKHPHSIAIGVAAQILSRDLQKDPACQKPPHTPPIRSSALRA